MQNQLNKYLCTVALAIVSKCSVNYANYQFIVQKVVFIVL